MSVSTDAPLEKCPRCAVKRIELQMGQWCPTCGYNPDYEHRLAESYDEISELNSKIMDLEDQVKHWQKRFKEKIYHND